MECFKNPCLCLSIRLANECEMRGWYARDRRRQKNKNERRWEPEAVALLSFGSSVCYTLTVCMCVSSSWFVTVRCEGEKKKERTLHAFLFASPSTIQNSPVHLSKRCNDVHMQCTSQLKRGFDGWKPGLCIMIFFWRREKREKNEAASYSRYSFDCCATSLMLMCILLILLWFSFHRLCSHINVVRLFITPCGLWSYSPIVFFWEAKVKVKETR